MKNNPTAEISNLKSPWLHNQRLLVIAPHPDDEVLGCAGLIASVKKNNGKVFVLIVTVGDIKQYGGESKTNARLEEVKQVMDFLKVDGYEVALIGEKYHLKLDTLPQKQLIDLIEKDSKVSILKTKPTIVAIPSVNSTNQDHVAVFDAALAACRPALKEFREYPKTVISYETPINSWSRRGFVPNAYIDISDFIEVKIKSLSLYKSQLQKSPHPRSLEGVRKIAEFRGNEICAKAAEGFIVHRFIL